MTNPTGLGRVAALVALTLCFIGCGTSASSEGGIVGSGISSIQGNIVDVQIVPDAPGAPAQRDGGAEGSVVPTIAISIDEHPGTQTTTDAAGEFKLDGEFAGSITMRFRAAGDDDTLGTLVVEIGAGATVVLSDIEIRTDLPDEARVQVRPPLQINLFGSVTARDCDANRLEIEDESPGRNRFVLRLRADSEIVNADDSGALRCDQIGLGDRVTVVEGIVDREAVLIDTIKLRVQPVDPLPPPVVRVRRRGIVLRTACARGFVYFQDRVPNDLVSARLTAETEITCGAQSRPCVCDEIEFGDVIDVVGTRRAQNARSIEVTQLHIARNPASTFVSTAAGDVVSIDCTTGTLRALVTEVFGDVVRPQELHVELSDATTYRCFGNLACTCADVRARDRVVLELLVAVDQSTVPEAIEVVVVGAARLRLAGVIDAVDCAAGLLRVASDANPAAPVELQLTRATEVTLADGSRTTCRSLAAGLRVGVSGHVERGVPGAVRRNVAELVRLERPRRAPNRSVIPAQSGIQSMPR
jgi:hypothetical protein